MTFSRFVAAASIAALAAGCQTAARSSTPTGAVAAMRGGLGQPLGTLRLEQTTGGVRVSGELGGLPTGTHGIHIHAVGRCDTPDFTTAGGHFDVSGHKHGLDNPAGPHAGDMPNLTVPTSGRAAVELLDARVTLDSASATSLFDADGSAIVIHAGADDQRTDPSGGSGARIACGVVTRA